MIKNDLTKTGSSMDESSANFESVPDEAEKTVTEVLSNYQLDKITMKIDALMNEVTELRDAGAFTRAIMSCQVVR